MSISDENKKMLEKLQNLEAQEAFHRQTLADILAFSTRLTRNSDLKTLYSESNTLALNILKLDFSTLMILSDDGKALIIRDAIGFPSSMIDSFSLLEGQGLSTLIVKEKKAAIVQDFQTEKRFKVPPVVFKENIVSAIAVPMLIGDTVFGVMIGHTKTKRIFTLEEINLYQSIANQSAVAIKNVMHFESLQDSEKRFRTLIDRAGDAIFLADMNGRLMDVNKMACQTLGYTREELLKMTVLDVDPLAKETRPQEGLWANLSSDQYVTINSQHRRKDESLFPVEIRIGLLALQNTNYILGFARDITERKQAEQKIHEAYDIINKSSSIAFLWKNEQDWPVEFVSDNVLQLTGYSSQEFTAGKILYSQIIHPDDLERVSLDVDKASKDTDLESFTHEPYRIITRNEQIKWVADHTHLRKNKEGRITHYQGIVEDITAAKKAELALRKSKEEWEKTFNAMSDIVTIQDKDMRIVRANKAAHDFFEVNYGDLVGKYCYEVFSGITEPCPGCPELKTLETIQCHSEIIQHKKLGKIFHVSSAPILGENNEIEFLVHIAKDITEQKRLEEELFQAHKMEAIGTLAGGIAHDFNNILSAILSYSILAKEDLPAGSEAGKDIDQVITAGKRAADLVKQILSFSRKTDYKLYPLAPHLVVKEALKMLRSTLPTTIVIQEDIDPECGTILADPTGLHQIIVNLCTNALHAMEDQKGTLTVSLHRQEIREKQTIGGIEISAGPFIVLSVSDTGCGIGQATIDRIFEPYFTTKETGRGTGMGLAAIHGIVLGYKGAIKVESAPGQGSTFYVYLPALHEKTSDIEELIPEKTDANPLAGNGRILVVDDEPVLIKAHKRQLTRLGYRVTGTTDSKDALEKIRTHPEEFDLLITDQTMPGLSGIELATAVQKIKPALPIILCTGHSDVVSKEDALAMGIKKYVSKPIYREELSQAIREVLDEK